MILVTGTKRSGTSMWMQALIAAGLPHIGDAFPAVWGESIREANPNGFYESRFRRGVYFGTNPDPKTGAFIHPNESKAHVVKVFIPGLIRTDLAFIYRVVATLRHWRDYDASLSRLYRLEDQWLDEQRKKNPDDPKLKTHRSSLPPAMEWWFENYELIRDITSRRYPVNVVTYDRLLADPEASLAPVLKWIGSGDLQKACEAIDKNLQSQRDSSQSIPSVEPEDAEVFDELYHAIHTSAQVSPALLDKMNQTQKRLETRWRPTPQRDRTDTGPGFELAEPATDDSGEAP